MRNLAERGADFLYTYAFRGGGYAELASIVMTRAAEVDPVLPPAAPWKKHGLRLCIPPEHGFERDPDFQPPEAA